MTTNQVKLTWGYRTEGHLPIGSVDHEFFHKIPDYKEIYTNPTSGRPEMPRPDVVQVLTVAGTAILSSSVLAAFIKSYLESRRTKVRISIEYNKTELEYIGPNFKDSEESIKNAIDHVVSKTTNNKYINIEAHRLPDDKE